MKTVNWDVVVSSMKQDLLKFVRRELSSHNLYKKAVSLGIGSEVRRLVRPSAERARKITREALRRRNIVVN